MATPSPTAGGTGSHAPLRREAPGCRSHPQWREEPGGRAPPRWREDPGGGRLRRLRPSTPVDMEDDEVVHVRARPPAVAGGWIRPRVSQN